jgi:hypothetical protein
MMMSRRMRWTVHAAQMRIREMHIYEFGEKARRKQTTRKNNMCLDSV